MMIYGIYGLTVLVASMICVVSGFGFGTIMLAVLSVFMPIKSALLYVGILHLLGNVYKIWAFKGGYNQISLAFIVGGMICSFIGATLSGQLPSALLKQCLGILLIIYPLLILYRPHIHLSPKKPFAILGGSLSGFFSGLIGMGGVIRSLFLSLYNLPKEVYVASSGMIALAVDVTRVAVYSYTTPINLSDQWPFFAVGIPALSVGVCLGKKLVMIIPQAYFRLVIALCLALFGLFHLLY